MPNRYDFMKSSVTETNEKGVPYPDPLTFQELRFRVTKTPLEYNLTASDIKRFDILMYRAYGSINYGDLILAINNIGILDDVEVGTTIYLPDKTDIDRYVIDYNIGEN